MFENSSWNMCVEDDEFLSIMLNLSTEYIQLFLTHSFVFREIMNPFLEF